MSVFDKSRQEIYDGEVHEKWGSTEAYKESKAKTEGYSKDKWNEVLEGMSCIFSEFALCKNSGESADGEAAKLLVKKLKDYICENFYNCTDEILCGLGQMYVCDERFKNNIDKSGEGCAEFVSLAIENYCNK